MEEPVPAQWLNQSTINSLKSLDDNFLKEMFLVFLYDMGQNLNSADQSLSERDSVAFKAACHAMKNASACLGADRLHNQCHLAMNLDQSNLQSHGIGTLNQLKQTYHQTCKRLETLVNNTSGL